jgi:DNA primase
MFPITDLGGSTIAFGGRTIGEAQEGQPKYLNSQESPLFQKRRSLFGLATARETIRQLDRAIVVEGYVDVIALAQAGITNVVAPLGTSLTAEQVRLLRRFTDSIVVLFDGDAAGASAAVRSFAVFAEVSMFADAAFLPEGQDPDSFVRSAGRENVERIIAGASPLVDVYLRSLAPRDAPLARRMRGAEGVAELIGRLENSIFVGLFARRAAEYLEIAEDQLLGRVRKPTPAPRPTSPPAASPAKPPPAFSRQESLIVELLLLHPHLKTKLPSGIEARFASEEARSFLRRVQEADADAADFLGELSPPARERVARALLGESDLYTEPERMLEDALARIAREHHESLIRAIGREIRDAESRGDVETVQRLLAEKQKLSAEATAAAVKA